MVSMMMGNGRVETVLMFCFLIGQALRVAGVLPVTVRLTPGPICPPCFKHPSIFMCQVCF